MLPVLLLMLLFQTELSVVGDDVVVAVVVDVHVVPQSYSSPASSASVWQTARYIRSPWVLYNILPVCCSSSMMTFSVVVLVVQACCQRKGPTYQPNRHNTREVVSEVVNGSQSDLLMYRHSLSYY